LTEEEDNFQQRIILLIKEIFDVWLIPRNKKLSLSEGGWTREGRSEI